MSELLTINFLEQDHILQEFFAKAREEYGDRLVMDGPASGYVLLEVSEYEKEEKKEGEG